MEERLKIAICEDNPDDAKKLLAMLAASTIPNRCTVYPSGEALLRSYSAQKYDLLLMDIYLDGMTGVETVAKIRTMDEEIPIAFVTASLEHTLEGYRLSVLRYIQKPYQQDQLEDILELARMKRDSAPMLTVQRNGKYERIRISRITYLEQQTHQLFLHLEDGTAEPFYEKLSDLLPQLEGQDFMEPHKSYSVNLNYVRGIDRNLRCFVMQDGTNIPIRRETMARAKKKLEEFLFNRTRGVRT